MVSKNPCRFIRHVVFLAGWQASDKDAPTSSLCSGVHVCGCVCVCVREKKIKNEKKSCY